MMDIGRKIVNKIIEREDLSLEVADHIFKLTGIYNFIDKTEERLKRLEDINKGQ